MKLTKYGKKALVRYDMEYARDEKSEKNVFYISRIFAFSL